MPGTGLSELHSAKYRGYLGHSAHATGVAVYPALFLINATWKISIVRLSEYFDNFCLVNHVIDIKRQRKKPNPVLS